MVDVYLDVEIRLWGICNYLEDLEMLFSLRNLIPCEITGLPLPSLPPSGESDPWVGGFSSAKAESNVKREDKLPRCGQFTGGFLPQKLPY